MTDTANDALLPCPLCGAEADYTGSPGAGYRVQCKGCLAQSGWGDYGYQVQAKWNARAPAPEPVGREAILAPLIQLRDELKDCLHRAKEETPNDNIGIQVEAARLKTARKALESVRSALSAITPHKPAAGVSDPEPVAWQSRACIGGKWGSWLNMEQSINKFRQQHAFNLHNGTYEVRPLYATPAVVDREAWQDIATAPRDGTPFLCFRPDDAFSPQTGIDLVWYEPSIKTYTMDGDNEVPFAGITHWCPLPVPPAAIRALSAK